jgi:hypothetical protein
VTVVPLHKYNCPERATFTGWYFCEHCENIHVAFKDKNGRIYTEATMTDAGVLALVATLLERRKIIEDG